MAIIWDSRKNKRLKATRQLSFDDVAQILLDKRYLAVLENPSHPDQMIFLVWYKNYTHVVPFVIDADDNIVLKTIFPSRKFHKLHGDKNDENKT